MKQRLYGVINTVKKLNGTINVTASKAEIKGAISGGFWIPFLIGTAKGFGATPTTTKTLIDVNGYILKDSSGSILTVMEGDEAWQTSTDS